MRRRHLTIAAFAALGAVAAAACQPVAAPPPPPATPLCQSAPGSTIPGQWVATVDPDGPAPTEVVTFEASTPAAKQAEIEELDEDGTVLTVEPDRVVATLDAIAPGNDPSYASQQAVALAEAGFPGAWSAGFGGQGVTIAILDTGVQRNHEDLAGRVAQGADFVSGSVASPQGNSDFARIDLYGHGTHVAGIAAASDNTIGGIGGAPLSTILPVRVLNSCGSGSFSDVAEGIRWAADQGAEVISMSLGGAGSCTSGVVKDAVDHARALGAVLVAAAGNSNSGVIGVPAICDGVIAVGATSGSGDDATKASFSNYGAFVDVAAPGSSIYSTYIPAPSAYQHKSGTSMSTPFVAAAAALVYQECQGMLTPPSAASSTLLADLVTEHSGPGLAHKLTIAASSGTYSLTYAASPSESTGPVPFDATALQVQAALESLPAIGVGNVTVSGGPIAPGGRSELFLTVKDIEKNKINVTVAPSLSGGSVAMSPILPGPNRQTATVSSSGGTFTLAFLGQSTGPIAFDSTPGTVEAALEALSTIGAGNVAVTESNGVYTIEFTGTLASNTTDLIAAGAAGLGPISTLVNQPPFPGRLDAAAAIAAACAV